MFEETSGKKYILYEWEGNNNNVRTEPEIGEDLVWFASNSLHAMNNW